jgi:FdhD protein
VIAPGGAPAVAETAIQAVVVAEAGAREAVDQLAVEAPLEIRVRARGGEARPLSITMRTPGDDAELVAGFLFTEALVRTAADLAELTSPDDETVVVTLAAGVALPDGGPDRAFAMTSACGVCGKTSLATLRHRPPYALTPGAPRLAAALVASLPQRLREAQPTFAATGGIHAAGLFDATGALLVAREDVGRHNAVDKVVGARLLAGALPAQGTVLVVSGRASFELVQKAVMAGIPVLAAVGAPSTLAVSLAALHGLTLLGFVRDGRFNVYAGRERVELPHGRV